MTKWTIVPVNWEYNDEHNFIAGFGLPTKLYSTLEEAKKRKEELTVKTLRGIEFDMYEDVGWYLDKEFYRTYEEVLNVQVPDGNWGLEIPMTATDEQIKRLMPYIDLNFYEVIKLEEE